MGDDKGSRVVNQVDGVINYSYMSPRRGPEGQSIRLLQDWPGGLYYSPDKPSGNTAALIERHFMAGSPAFQGGDVYERYFVTRVRNYAQITAFVEAEVWKSRVVNTGDSAPEKCKEHNGRMISVLEAAGHLDRLKTLTGERYFEEAFDRDLGFPPFSIDCYCRLEAA